MDAVLWLEMDTEAFEGVLASICDFTYFRLHSVPGMTPKK